jgi:class 3 adenylate cyclase
MASSLDWITLLKTLTSIKLVRNFSFVFLPNALFFTETIGDGYLVVSGLPKRNGDRHVDEISQMAFRFMNYMADFRVNHLPLERVQLRIGFHTGIYFFILIYDLK